MKPRRKEKELETFGPVRNSMQWLNLYSQQIDEVSKEWLLLR